MTTKFDQRLLKLEQSTSISESITMVINLVVADNGKPAAVQPEPIGARVIGDTWSLRRDMGESVDAFIERATEVGPRSEQGVCALILEYDV